MENGISSFKKKNKKKNLWLLCLHTEKYDRDAVIDTLLLMLKHPVHFQHTE